LRLGLDVSALETSAKDEPAATKTPGAAMGIVTATAVALLVAGGKLDFDAQPASL
jgi:hypothetical protein